MDNIIQNTGELFGNLFAAFDQENFLRSVSLFEKRFRENEFDVSFFQGKKCLDLGCGGGRYSIAMSMLGAESVTGIDISKVAIEDAQKRAQSLNISNTHFIDYDGYELPFRDEEFDCVIWSGVIMHTANPRLAMQEVNRVTKSKGMLYMLVYATEGLRWPLVSQLRNITSLIPFSKMDYALNEAGLDVNKRRTYLDDLYVPLIDFYSFDRLKMMLSENGFNNVKRWDRGRLDHEENLESYIKDLKGFELLFQTASNSKEVFEDYEKVLLSKATNIISSIISYCEEVSNLKNTEQIDEKAARLLTIGQGHHRVICYKN